MQPNDTAIAHAMAAHGPLTREPHGAWRIQLGAGLSLRFYYNAAHALVWAEDASKPYYPSMGRALLEVVDGRWHFMALTDCPLHHLPAPFHAAMLELIAALMGHDEERAIVEACLSKPHAVSYCQRVAALGFKVDDFVFPPDDTVFVREAIEKAWIRWRALPEPLTPAGVAQYGQCVPPDQQVLDIDGVTVILADIGTDEHPRVYVLGPLGDWQCGVRDLGRSSVPTMWRLTVPGASILAKLGNRYRPADEATPAPGDAEAA